MPAKKPSGPKQRKSPTSDASPALTAPPPPAQAAQPQSTVSTQPNTSAALIRPARPAAAQTVDPVLDTLARLETLRVKAQSRLDDLDKLNPPDDLEQKQVQAAQDKLNDLLDAISDAKTAINQQAIEEHTISLQAAEAELDPGIERMERLRDDLAKVAKTITDVSDVISGIESAVDGARSILAGFGA